MSYTNHTSNYNLPQYVGTDKPTYLGDFNTAMGIIDLQMKANADSASTAGSGISTLTTSVGTLASLTTTDKTDLVSAINEVDSHANTAQETANTASGIATGAQTVANGLATYLSLTGRQNLTVTTSGGTIDPQRTEVASAYNSDGSLGKIYGKISLTFSTTPPSNVVVTISDTGLRPNEDITINGLAITNVYASGSFNYSGVEKITIHTNGTATLTLYPSSITTTYQFILPPCLLFMVNFGD